VEWFGMFLAIAEQSVLIAFLFFTGVEGFIALTILRVWGLETLKS